jgi:hypothetical protein
VSGFDVPNIDMSQQVDRSEPETSEAASTVSSETTHTAPITSTIDNDGAGPG